MRLLPLIFIVFIGFTSCKSSKLSKSNKTTTYVVSKTKNSSSIANAIINNAQYFSGTKYKFGGTTKKGMDCSGLIYVAFKNENIFLPRVSRDMATKGHHIKLNETKKGDLLFFQTNKNKRIINHVGLVVEATNNYIKFIHATTSKGVITSSLSERYWMNTFKEARRVL